MARSPRHIAVSLPLALAALGSIGARGAAQSPPSPATNERRVILFPGGDVFQPLLADPKQPHFFATFVWASSPRRSTQLAPVGFGESIGLVRWSGARSGDGVQVSAAGGAFSEFDLGSSSTDLLNTDFVIGVPVSYRRGAFSTRVRLYHQSSHLGDEEFPGSAVHRKDIVFQALEAIVSLDAASWRVYGGGEYLFDRQPPTLHHAVLRGGVEFRDRPALFNLSRLGSARFVSGVNAQTSEASGWAAAWSLRAGLEFRPATASRERSRGWSFLLEAWHGPSPYGEPFIENVTALGMGLHFGL